MSSPNTSDGESLPYELSLMDGVTPTDAAWLDLTNQVPMSRYPEATGRDIPVGFEDHPIFSLQMTGLFEKPASTLADLYQEELKPHTEIRERLQQHLIGNGMPEAQARHLVNIFALGILVGARSAEITHQYAQQGIDKLTNPKEGE